MNTVFYHIKVFFSSIKTLGYFFGIFLFQYLNIPQEPLTLLGLLMVLDTFTGVAKAARLDGRKSITSHAATMGVIKKSLVFCVVVGLAIMIKGTAYVIGVDFEGQGLLSVLLGILMIAEFYSICQNVYMFRTGVRVTEYDAISIIIKKLGEYLKDKVENFLVKEK